MVIEPMESRRLLTTELGAVRPSIGDALNWALSSQLLSGPIVNHSFDYGLKAGAPGAGTLGDDYARSGDLSGIGFDQVIAIRSDSGTLQWLGDTDRDLGNEYRFRFGSSDFTPLVADMNGDGIDDIIAIDTNTPSALNEWFVHYGTPLGYPTDDSPLSFDASFSFGSNGDKLQIGDINGDGRADAIAVQVDGASLDWKIHFAQAGTPYPNSTAIVVGIDQTIENFGSNNDTPVVGNWDNNGGDNIGAVNSDTSPATWNLDTNGGGASEISVQFGLPNSQFIVGNWADILWNGNANLNWSDGANWSGSSVPTSANSVVIDQPSRVDTIAVNVSANVRSLITTEPLAFSSGLTSVEDIEARESISLSNAITIAARSVSLRDASLDNNNLSINASASVVMSGDTSSTTGGLMVASARGIRLAAGGSITTTSGTISLLSNQQLVASDGNFDGVFIGGPIATSTGPITIAGKSGTATDNHGVRLVSGGSVASTSASDGAAPISVTGRSVGAGTSDGIRFDFGGSISSNFGDIQLTGVSDNDNGIDTFSGTIASTATTAGAATITLNGTSNGSSVGTFIGFGHLITSQIGDIAIAGQSAAGIGLEFNFTGRVRSLGTGADAANILLSGTSLATSGTAYGALLSNAFGDATTLAGDISVVGTSSAPSGSGVNIGAAFTISAGGSGSVSITGDGVSTGVLLGQSAGPLIQSSSGSIAISTPDALVGLVGTNLISGAGVLFDVAQTSTFAGDLNATGSFTKIGSGQITFNGRYNVGGSTFQGGLTSFPVTANVQSVGSAVSITGASVDFSSGEAISSGNITLTSGTWTGSDNVAVTGRLSGTGTIASSVTIIGSATLAPGNSPGILNTGNLTFIGGSLLEIELGGLSPGNSSTDHDQINVTGTVSLAGNLSVLKFNGFTPTSLNSFTIINNDGVDAVVGTFTGLTEGSTFTSDGATYSISYVGGTGNDVVITAVSTVYLVTNANDSGAGSLRQAILDSNSNVGSDTIRFNISGVGPHEIQLSTALPTITDSVGIDGYSQPGYAGTPVVVLNGAAVVGVGLTLGAGSGQSTIRGLAINRFAGVGVLITSSSNTLHGNFVGTSADGMSASGNATWGVMVIGGANNTIGGTAPGNRNVVSGNLQGGIAVIASGANNNKIQGNLIGVNASGNADLGNTFSGMFIGDASGFSGGHTGFATNTIVGGDSAAARNVISGNNSGGIVISGSGASGNVIRGNYIGTNAGGNAAIGNSFWGITVNNAPNNTIGGINPGEGNLVSGNNQGGVAIYSAGAVNNVVQGNYIGVNAAGNADLGNSFSGVYVGFDFAGVNGSASNNTIGGSVAGARNIISGNNNYGVWITGVGASDNVVAGNYIGTDKDGAIRIANSLSGVAINTGASNNQIGTDADGSNDANEGNLISGNANHGVWISGSGATGNTIAGNRIGTTADGLNALGNTNSGIFITGGASNNTIGGMIAAAGNVIGGNATGSGLPGEGVNVNGATSNGNQILGNSIGIGVDGTTAIANGFAGIRIFQAVGTIVGGLTATPGVAPGNIISSNLVHGISIDAGASGTSIQGNLIGTDASGMLDRGNALNGIQILTGANNNTVGGSLANSRNVISGNNQHGVLIDGVGTNNNVVAGNYIGTNIGGSLDLGNTGHGVAVYNGADDTRIGTDGSNDAFNANERNVISGNDLWAAVAVGAEGTDRTIIAGNYIGTNKDGNAAIGSGGHSVVVFNGADDTRIGTDGNGVSDSDERNVLSGNLWGVVVEGAATFRTVIAGNYIGTNKNGDAAIPNGGSGAIEVRYGARDTRIGTDGSNDLFNENERNVISGNSTNGIFVQTPLYDGLAPSGGLTTDGTIVAGNFIGLNALGTATLANSGQGIYVRNRATNVRIGTDGNGIADLEERNVISANTGSGILIEGWSLMGLSIAEQFVSGTYPTSSFAFSVPQADIVDASSSAAGNWGFNHGIPGGGGNYFAVRATGTLQVNTAGTFTFAVGSDDGGRLRINGADVVVDDTAHAFDNRFGNVNLTVGTHTFEWYGLESAGAAGFEVSVAVGGGKTNPVNRANGWEVLGSGTPHSQIALVGTIAATVYYSEPGMINTRIAGNRIGTDPGGTLDFGNAVDGIRIQTKAQGVTIGGSSSSLQNVISGNNSDGIEFGLGGLNNVVSGNIIGLNALGNAMLGNSGFGVNITAGNVGTRIGTNSDNVGDAAERNIISGNLKGIQVSGIGSNQALIAGNYIGTDISGMSDLGNTQEGVLVLNNAGPTHIGGTSPSARNVISGNNAEGIEFSNVINGSGSTVRGNYVGVNALGTGALGNVGLGGILVRGTSGVILGGSIAGAGNVISGNLNNGVTIRDATSLNTIVQGNLIGTDFSGTADIGNAADGVSVQLGATNNTIGGSDSGLLQFDVDGFNAPVGETQAGRARMTEAGMLGDSANGNFVPTATLQGVSVIAARTVGSNTAWRDRGTVGLDFNGQPLNQLLRDSIGVDAPGAEINVTIAGLPAGTHQITSFHHDWNVWAEVNTFDVLVNDASGTNLLKSDNADFISSINPYLGTTYNVVSNGRDPIVIRIVEDSATNRVRFNGLTIQSLRAFAGNIISGNAGDGVDISDASGAATVVGNFIGLSASGNSAIPNDQNGVILQGAVSNVTIGGIAQKARNIIGGNLLAGVSISGPAASANSVIGNSIGTDATGTVAVANGIGVSIANGAFNNTIGGSTNLAGTGAGNVISGNSQNGIVLLQTALDNSVFGNLIGLASDGSSTLGNGQSGILVSSLNTIIGGDDDDDGSADGTSSRKNVISGNATGITVSAAGTNLNTRIQGNFLGTNRAANSAVPNTVGGILIDGATGTRVGGTTAGAGNVVSGNTQYGISISGASAPVIDLQYNSIIQGNFIGTNATGLAAIPNARGVQLFNANNLLGGAEAGSRNVVSGNITDGIWITGASAISNWIQANYIGVDANGTRSLSNATGVTINTGAALNLIGGSTQTKRNVISGNIGNGVAVTAAGNLNKVQGNYIGTDFSGTVPLGNASTAVFEAAGVHVSSMAGNSVIIGTESDLQSDALEGNLISGNFRNGVRIDGGNSDSGSHIVAGNLIGVDFSATNAMPNQGDGIVILSSSANRIGTNGDGVSDALEANTIAGNQNLGANPGGASLKAAGILILDSILSDGKFAANNLVAGNFFGTDSSTTRALGNQAAGIRIDAANATIVGSSNPSFANFIHFGKDDGIQILGTAEGGTASVQSTDLRINSFTSNAGLAIDLGDDGVSRNDNGDVDGITNFPILTSVTTQNDELTVRGVIPAGKSFELYIAAPKVNSKFGEGQTFLATFTEGVNDSAGGLGSYGPSVENVDVSLGMVVDSSFEITIPLPAGLNPGMLVTARTLGATSEFGLLAIVGEQASRIAPIISLDATATILVGETLQLTSSFVDPDSSSWTATVDYGDGSPVSFLTIGANNTLALDHNYALDGDYSVVVTVTDNSLVTSTANLLLTVNNTAPQVAFNEVTLSSPIGENLIATLSGTFNNPNLSDSHTVTINWDDGSPATELVLPPGVREFTATHRFVDDSNADLTPSAEDPYNVQVIIGSNGGADASPLGLYLVQVQNVAPRNLVVTPSALSLGEGDMLQFSGSFSDPGVLDTHRVRVDWGDGTTEEFHIGASGVNGVTTKLLPLLSHTYESNQVSGNSSYQVIIEVTDDDEPLNPVRYTREFPVVNVSPSAVTLNLSGNTIFEGQSVSVSGSFIDPGQDDVHRLFVDWGDGTNEIVDLQKGVRNFSGLMHSYPNDAPGAGGFSIVVRVADTDSPQVFGSASAILNVVNISPQIVQASLTPFGIIDEGSTAVLSGLFTDTGALDRHRVMVNWGDGHTTEASIDAVAKSFTASHPYGDNFDPANVTVTVEDGRHVPVIKSDGGITLEFEADGGIGSAVRTLQIRNVAPTVFIAPQIGSTPTATILAAEVIDPGFDDTFQYTWSIDSGLGYSVFSTSQSLTLNSTAFSTPPRILLQVSDDDGGSDSYEVLAVFGSDAPETIILDEAGFTVNSVRGGNPLYEGNILAMGFGGSDTIIASGLGAQFNAILDGGQQTDFLIGGAGADRFYAHDGNDEVDGGAGSDVFIVKPNSTLTVVDRIGDNVLDFSNADFGDSSGITFNLGLINLATFSIQDVSTSHANQHFVRALGRFTTLIGSDFGDVLVAASGSRINGGRGSDQLKVQNGAVGSIVEGGADSDVLTIDVGNTVGSISFSGDIGADTLLNRGEIHGLDFSGGADNDIFSNFGIITDLRFNGDAGADTFSNLGVLTELTYSGGADNDIFTNELNGRISELVFSGDLGDDTFINIGQVDGLNFTGGADNDIFRNVLNAQIDDLVFTGDDGADIFENFGTVNNFTFGGGADDDVFINVGDLLGSLVFSGGADDDIFSNRLGATVEDLNFSGDIGADLFENAGSIFGSVVFGGGADSDVFTNLGSIHDLQFNGGADDDILRNFGTVDDLNFEGDLGMDIFENHGQVHTLVTFNGGADDDILRNFGTVFDLNFGGDNGADILENSATVVGRLTFIGGSGADDGADLLRNLGHVHELLFNGGSDSDVLINLAPVDSLTFIGGADDDTFSNSHPVHLLVFDGGADSDFLSNSGEVGTLQFVGGADNDFFSNSGRVLTELVFNGGADDDIFINRATAESINFFGDSGVDLFRNFGAVGELDFEGGADSDTFLNLVGGVIQELHFGGDEGGDFLSNHGAIDTLNYFGDGGIDTLINVGSVTDLTFAGGADNDLFRNTGVVAELDFGGGADQDVLQNDGSIVDINFSGDDGADILLNYGGFESLEFTGGGDDDVFASYGNQVGTINFFGDLNPTLPGFDANVGGADKMIIRGSAGPNSRILFHGGKGGDAFQNDASGFLSITFEGGADADVFQNNADSISTIVFEGDAGADVFENNGDKVRFIVFNGGADADVFVNDGAFVSDLIFNGGSDHDLFINTGDHVSQIDFLGDAGVDSFVNSGEGLEDVVFTGGADNDSFLNTGFGLTDFVFNGDSGDDRFWNQHSGTQARRITFIGDLGADIFVNDAAAVSELVFSGGADNDGFQNNGASLNQAVFNGGAGDDRLVNTGAAVSQLTFNGDAGNDSLGNLGRGVGRIEFYGGADSDSFVNSGLEAEELVFRGGADGDTFTNDGSALNLNFFGEDGSDALYNNGSIRNVNFTGSSGGDLLQNNGPAQTLRFYGGEDSDVLVNNAGRVMLIHFEGDAGVDSLINNGNDIEAIEFSGGSEGDYLRLQGSFVSRVDFDGGIGSDTFEFDAVGGQSSVVTFQGGQGNDFLAWLGTANFATADLGADNDQVVLAGTGTLQLNDGGGNDSYLFANNPQMSVTIGEQFAGAADNSFDTLDFSSFVGGALNLDLGVISIQPQGSHLKLQLTDAMGIEAVIGTEFGDTVLGNGRDNTLLGAKYFAGYSGPVARTRNQTQWVFLDFDSKLDVGEHIYTPEERNLIASRIEVAYRGPNTAAPWLDVRVVHRFADLYATGPYVTIYFNDTPVFGRPGGLASEIDLGNTNLGGTAQVQVNGLVGGAVTADEAIIRAEPLPQGMRGDSGGGSGGGCNCGAAGCRACHGDATLFGDVTVGTLKPAATSENFVRLSAKIAGHELGHLLGLRHQDAFGPIGYGIHNPPGGNAYTPVYSGPSGGFESFNHLIGSPATIGSSRFTDLNDLYFGEREAIKLAFAGSDPEDTIVDETIGSHDNFQTAQALSFITLDVPFAQDTGFNSRKQKFVQVKSVNGRIDLGSNQVSESDFYSFSGLAGDIVNIDVFSNSLVGRFGSGPDDFLDTIVRVYDSSGNLVPYHGTVAENDDQFEPTDSSLVDLILPADGIYYVEVDSFKRSPQDPVFDAENPSSPINPSNPNNILRSEDLQKRFLDTRDDTDVGKYQLIVYRFANQNANDGIDILKGKGGVDVLNGGAGDSYSLRIAPLTDSPAALGATFSKTVAFSDPGGSEWTAIVDFGDGSAPKSYTGFDPNSGLTINHIYTVNGVYTVRVTIQNDDFVIGRPNSLDLKVAASFRVTVTGLGYALSLSSSAITVTEGKTGTLGVSLTRQPASTVTVRLSQSGDTDFQLNTTALLFTTSNWNVRQNVVISANEDIDVANGIANVLVSSPLHSLNVVLTEADNDRLTPVITSLVASPTNVLVIPMTVNFGQIVTGFDATDVKVVGGMVSDFTSSGNGLYSFNILPTINGTITVDVAAGAAKDIGNKTTLAAIRKSIVSDRIAPAAIVTGPTKLTAATFTITINFGEIVNGFVATDILATNAIVTNLVNNGNGRFTASLSATANGLIAIEVPNGVAIDAAGSGNLPSNQYVVATTNGIDVQLNATQRSFERYLDLRFVTSVGLQDLIANQRIMLERYATNGANVNTPGSLIPIATPTVVGSSIRLDFGSNGLGGLGRNGNGFYRVSIDLDGDGQFDDGRFEFFRLYGDANGDGKVDAADASLLVDLNGDGRADVRDRAISRDQLGNYVDLALLALIDD